MAASSDLSGASERTQPAAHRRVCVLGGGCIGLSTAVLLAERLRDHYGDGSPVRTSVTIVSESFPPSTTSNVAAGLVRPFSVANAAPQQLDRWTTTTRKWLEKHMALVSGPERGIFPMFVVEGSDNEDDPPGWMRKMNAFKMLNDEEKSVLRLPSPCAWMWQTLIVESGLYLDYLKRVCVQMDVQFVEKKIESMDELAEYDLVVNCTGLASRTLFNDMSMVPVRGQIMRVRAPWIKHITIFNTGSVFTYIIPNKDMVVLGGTTQEGNWSTEVSPTDSADIWARCCEVIPSLRRATVLEETVGLRPLRKDGVRIALENVRLQDGRYLPVVHNYGHGGSGFTIHWGCAEDAVELAMPALRLPGVTAVASKL
eukprot:scpid61133/ scgid27869/ D-amino-acid oxidase